MRYVVPCVCLTAVAALCPARASAHDGPPEPLSLHWRGDDGDAGRVMGASFGLLQSVNGSGWDVICSEAIGYFEPNEPVVHWSAGGTLFVGSPKGLWVSRDGGCTWTPHATFTSRGASDVRGAPGQPNAVFVTTSKFGAQNGLFRSDDDGFNFTALLSPADTQFTAIRFAPSDAMRAFASAWSLNSTSPLLYRSDDAGQSFSEVPVTAPWYSGFTLVAISVSDPDVLFASVFDGNEYVLLRSADGGANFSEVARDARAFRAIAFEPDGQTVWATANRLFQSLDGGKTFGKLLAPKRPACVTRGGGDTEVCGSSLDGFAIARLLEDGGVNPTFTFNQTRGLLSCAPGTTVHDVCTPLWTPIAALLGLPVPDAGTAVDAGVDGGEEIHDAGETSGSDAGENLPPPPPKGCGCATGADGASMVAVMFVALLAFWRWRDRSRGAGRGASAHTGFVGRASLDGVLRSDVAREGMSLGDASLDGVLRSDVARESKSPREAPIARALRSDVSRNGTSLGEAPSVGALRSDVSRNGMSLGEAPSVGALRSGPSREGLSSGDASRVASSRTCESYGGASHGSASSERASPAQARRDPLGGNTRARAGAASTVASAVAVSLTALLLSGCPPKPPPPPPPDGGTVDACDPNPCLDIHRTVCAADESGKALCFCDANFHEQAPGGACVANSPCDPNPCSDPHKTVCSLVGSSPVCGCDQGFVANGLGQCVPSPADCSAQHSDGDDYEPDECPAQARDIGTSGSQGEPHTIDPATDVDWFRVDATAGRIFRVHAIGSAADAIAADAWTGEPLAPVGTPHSEGFGIDAAWKAPSTGPLYFRIAAAPGMPPQASAYAVDLADLGDDDVGDDLATAREAQLNSSDSGALQFNGDADVLSYMMTSGHSWRVDASTSAAAGLEADFVVGDGAKQHGAQTTAGTLSFVTRTLSSGGTFVVVRTDPEAFNVPWIVSVTDLGVDDHGDSPEEGTELTAATPAQQASLERSGDRDVFTFTATAGHIYAFTCTPTSLTDCLVTMLDPTGAVVADDSDGGQGYVVAELANGGTYSVRVESSANGTGGYTYQLVDLGTDDHGDDPSTATMLGMPPTMGSSSGTGHIETPGDHDFLSFIADVDHIYRITCTRMGLADCNVRVFDVNGLLVAQDTNGGDGLTLRLYKGGGTFFVEYYGSGPATGDYAWKIEDLFHDDHGDDLFTATGMLANNAWVTGEIQTYTDPDWFFWNATQGEVYRIDCMHVSLADCLVTYLDASENVLAQDVDGQDALFFVKTSATAKYYLKVTAPSQELGTYWVKIQDLGADDCPETSTGAPLMATNGSSVTGSFEYTGDVDVRQLSLTPGATYQLTASGTTLTYTLYGSDGTTVVASGAPPASFSDATGGTHYLSVKAAAPTLLGPYTLTVGP